LANQEKLSSDDETTSEFLGDLPDHNSVITPEPTSEFISNPTIKFVSVSNILTSESTPNIFDTSNQETSPIPLIILCLQKLS
jgi:hypothetical protein